MKAGDTPNLSQGISETRRCTDIVCLFLFVLHIAAFWAVSLADSKNADPWKLVIPRDFAGDYCSVSDNWNNGTNMVSHDYQLYTMNVSATVDDIARSFACSARWQRAAADGILEGVTPAQFVASCSVGGLLDLSQSSDNETHSSVAQLSDPSLAVNLFSDLSGGASYLSALPRFFLKVCVSSCDLTTASSVPSNTSQMRDRSPRTYTYSPPPDASWKPVWDAITAHISTLPDTHGSRALLNRFKFGALSFADCPYKESKYCVPFPGISFTELTLGHCLLRLDSLVFTGLSGALAESLEGRAKLSYTEQATSSLGNAVGSITTTWEVFFLVAILSFIIGLVFLILLRFFVGITIWLSLFAVFLLFIAAGAAAFVYSSACANMSLTDSATSTATASVASASNSSNPLSNLPECIGGYKLENSEQRQAMQVFAYIFIGCGLVWLIGIGCLCRRIRLAISVFQVATQFVTQTPHILVIPIVQIFGAVGWCALWTFLAAVLLSQVPDDSTSTNSFGSYSDAVESSNCEVWKDEFGSDCMDRNMCWRCARPRYLTHPGFFLQCFALLWHNAFVVALGQCLIAGAVGVWFFTPPAHKSRMHEKGALRTALKNTFRYHLGSLAFGSFVIAAVMFFKWFLSLLASQAKAKNKVMATILKCLAYLVWCFEKAVKFLNKNAYIQIAIMGTDFCKSAKNAFFAVLRNAARFAVISVLGAGIHVLGKAFIVVTTLVLGFACLESLHPETEPFLLVCMYGIIGYFVGSLFMNVYAMAVDTCLQCLISVEQFGTGTECVPARLHRFMESQGTREGETPVSSSSRCCVVL